MVADFENLPFTQSSQLLHITVVRTTTNALNVVVGFTTGRLINAHIFQLDGVIHSRRGTGQKIEGETIQRNIKSINKIFPKSKMRTLPVIDRW